MKKFGFFILIVFAISIGAWMLQSSTHQSITSVATPSRTPAEIVEGDFDKIEKRLKQDNIQGNEWKEINNYAIKPEDLVTATNALAFFSKAQKNLPDLFHCLEKDFCGMESSPNDPYFDDQRTPAHILINRSLKIIKESLIENPNLVALVDWDLMDKLANSQQEMLEVEAIDIIDHFSPSSGGVENTLKASRSFTGTSKADSLIRVSHKATSSEKQLISNEIEEIFASGDAHTVISILESMDQMHLSKESMLKPFRNLCRFREDVNPGNWKMIILLANKLNPEFSKLCQY
jgi:hypothetical protein